MSMHVACGMRHMARACACACACASASCFLLRYYVSQFFLCLCFCFCFYYAVYLSMYGNARQPFNPNVSVHPTLFKCNAADLYIYNHDVLIWHAHIFEDIKIR